MRLVYGDKGCAVCLAAGIQAIYKYREDSNRRGTHERNYGLDVNDDEDYEELSELGDV